MTERAAPPVPADGGPGQSGREPQSSAPARVPFWDNARFACIVLVVIGHGLQRLTAESDTALALYLFLFAFHMPAFAIISGYFSRPGPPGTREMKKVFTDILLPYLIMEAIWTVVRLIVEGRGDFNPTTASWTLWFLLALAIFRLVLPYLALLRFPLAWAVVLSISVGYLANVDNTFSLSRAIGILPFFVLGFKLREWRAVDRWLVAERLVWWVRALSVAVLVGTLAVIVAFIGGFRDFNLRLWFFYLDPYSELGRDEWWAGAVRLGFLVLAVVLSAAFFSLIPRSQTWYTGFGQSTMYIYLLHTFVLYPLRESGVLAAAGDSNSWLAVVVLGCFGLSVALATPIVRRIFRPIIQPKPQWLFKNIDDAQAGPSKTAPPGSLRR